MRVLLYDYFLPYRSLFDSNSFNSSPHSNTISVDRYQQFETFQTEWYKDEEATIIIPLHTFDIVGMDIRKYFHDFDRNEKKKFILIGDKNQIAFCLSQNEFFLRNDICEIRLPILVNALETTIIAKMEL